jgi:radical SAM protein with 4Fe4S-binding SPASM domain
MKHVDKQAVTVNLTNKCNLSCIYCMASSSQEQTRSINIDTEFVKCGVIDALKGYPTGIPAKILRFFSPGEPTQNIECIKECVSLAKEFKPDIKIEMQTNGLFKNKNDCNWIANNIDIVWISLDGPKEVNGKYRPDEYGNDRTNEIEKNLRYLQERTFVGVRSTVVEETIDNQELLVEHFYNLGVKYLCVNPVIEPIERESRGNVGSITKIDISRFARGFLKGYGRAIELGIFYNSSLTFNFDEKTSIACRSCLPMPQLNPDGSVSSCDMALYKNSPSELQPFVYGIWNSMTKEIEYDLVKIDYLQKRKLPNLPKCKSCEIRENCAGGCAGRVAFEKGDIYDTISSYCEATKFLAQNMILNEGIVSEWYTHP